MFIDRDLKRVNIFAPYTDEDGVGHANLVDPRVREAAGITEIQEPSVPEDYSDITYFRTESQYPPYVEYTRKPDEMIQATLDSIAKTKALEYLNRTDWYIIRKLEEGIAIPEDVSNARKEARVTLNT